MSQVRFFSCLLLISVGWGMFLSAIFWSPDWSPVVIACVFVGVCLFDFLARRALPTGRSNMSAKRWRIPWSLPATFLFGVWAFVVQEFLLPDLSGIAFHLSYGVEGAPLTEYIPGIVYYLLLFALMIAAAGHLVANRRQFLIADRLLALPLILMTPFGATAAHSLSAFIEPPFPISTRLVEAPDLRPPDEPPNLIILYLESVEATNEQVSTPVPIFDDLSRLAASGLRLDGIGQATHTGFTMGGLVASQCGVPLPSLGLRSGWSFHELDSVVPGVTCLGDILDDQGYRTEYYGGADLDFGGKGVFFRAHGYDTVSGRKELAAIVESDSMNDWGVDDDRLYEIVFERIIELNQRSQPFAISMLTLAGHPPGYPTPRCLRDLGPVRIDQLLFSIKCSGYLARKFVQDIRKAGVMENTIVIVQSDHFAGNSAIDTQAAASDRSNYFVAIGNGIEEGGVAVDATMLDVFPTILELLGFHVAEGRAGLGVSLLDERRKTLREELGAAKLDRAIRDDTKLRAAIWGLAES